MPKKEVSLTGFNAGKLNVSILHDRKMVGESAAKNVAKTIGRILEMKDEVRIIFAAAPSQNEFLEYLTSLSNIPWGKIAAFHMDEYISLPKTANQLFSRYLNEHIFSKVNFKSVDIINSGVDDIEVECLRYEKLLNEKEIDIVCMGIGENGHIAFNDPPVADFNDKRLVKIVELDEICKNQQVNDGAFNSVDEVPKFAATLTVPALMRAKYLSVVVPGIRKAEAVRETINGDISTKCPATVLRTHENAVLFLDKDSASMLEK
jgi:glucosamine-6-phosphate deaminase